MNNNVVVEDFGVHGTARALNRALHKYIEAQYHIRDESLIAERDALLTQPKSIAQLPYVEATPVYELAEPYKKLAIPIEISEALEKISVVDKRAGIHPRPYHHQAEALEAFHGSKASDLVVATGTGSGKTESFLMPILGELVLESGQRPKSREMVGCRAILLYPMNALVNDQMARIRRLLGSKAVNQIVSSGRSRPVRFGSYTGRTPYPNTRSNARDQAQIAPLFEDFYIPAEQNPDLKSQLVAMGRWPSKDLTTFYNADASEEKTYSKGKKEGQKYVRGNWKYRLITQPGDRELMTRDEMQKNCPDILVTNYSMLEYMLLRPIEASIFEETAKWLAADERNQLILVLDEAHMYRGASGAEVAMLIRRLIARLSITRDRVRCILTSASLGKGEEAKQAVKEFAADLTGTPPTTKRSFEVITGRRETRTPGRSATAEETVALASIDLFTIGSYTTNTASVLDEISLFAKHVGWDAMPSSADVVPAYLYEHLTGFGPAELVISTVMGEAKMLEELRGEVFQGAPEIEASRALDALLSLCTLAKESGTGRLLMPTRLHLFFRGIPGLYACVNPSCNTRHAQPEGPTTLGRLHTKSTMSCTCSAAGRVFELRTHRDCGAAFLFGWVDKKCDFVWHEPDIISADTQQRKLFPIEMLVEKPSPGNSNWTEKWLHISTGRLAVSKPANDEGYRVVYIPTKMLAVDKELTFDRCPVCSKRTVQAKREESSIMDHVTKGEAPFSALVRAQLFNQIATKKKDRRFPNGGRKTLIFSDGRQKAARLARDLPRDMELDVFRQTIAAAVRALEEVPAEPRPTDKVLYLAFLSVLAKHNLSMFDLDAPTIDAHVTSFTSECGSLAKGLANYEDPGQPPMRYRIALLKLLCSNYYSLSGTTVGFVEPSKTASDKLEQQLGGQFSKEEVRALAIGWIDEMLSEFSFDPDIDWKLRSKAYGFWKQSWGSKASLPTVFKSRMQHDLSVSKETLDAIESVFRSTMAVSTDTFFLRPNALKLQVDLGHHWYQCTSCTALKPFTFRERCLNCGSTSVKKLDPKVDQYLQARKEYWRAPVADALKDDSEILNLYAEEHTAQLSNRDRKVVHSTTERHELRFQDVLISEGDRPIDVLSCTTTMEVGIDIGSLVAVALRNMPPQRENYQQRAGRAGRRGSSVSSVVTYSQNGPHDSHYFLNPAYIVSGSPRSPELKADNPKIARRHVHSFFFQTFFQEHKLRATGQHAAMLQKALGATRPFFHGAVGQPDLDGFVAWLEEKILAVPNAICDQIASWLPNDLKIDVPIPDWVEQVAQDLINRLNELKSTVPSASSSDDDEEDGEDDDKSEKSTAANFDKEDLLEFLFFHALLPSYAFPTSLCSFLVETIVPSKKGKGSEIRLEQMPQQSTNQALSEYAPGRLVVINKKTYRSGGVFANTSPKELNRAEQLFSNRKVNALVMCDVCSYVRDPNAMSSAPARCPVCTGELRRRQVIRPEVFGPENARSLPEDDREQDITYATLAQFPQPIEGDKLVFSPVGINLGKTYATECRLVTLNKGAKEQGEFKGFSVCRKCGAASVNSDSTAPRAGTHERPYFKRSYDAPRLCDGHFEDVFLWFDFQTDMAIARIPVREPLITDVTSVGTVRTLEAAAHSISEALRLAASRHKQLDLDATEFGAGHRILPPNDEGVVCLDIYLYDTLSGGAGYAELAAKYFDEIVIAALGILEGCSCDASCTDCLDHFYNQHLKNHLDRHLGASLLRYALHGDLPTLGLTALQERRLRPLAEMLHLDGMETEFIARQAAITLVVRKDEKYLQVFPYPCLLRPAFASSNIKEGTDVLPVNELELRANLPQIHSSVRDVLR
jgi:ATP-dependent helicase YprA (DUF1998 family)/uncharacterized protein with PIN domain